MLAWLPRIPVGQHIESAAVRVAERPRRSHYARPSEPQWQGFSAILDRPRCDPLASIAPTRRGSATSGTLHRPGPPPIICTISTAATRSSTLACTDRAHGLRRRTARVCVTVDDTWHVIGYYALAAGRVERGVLPERIRSGAPTPVALSRGGVHALCDRSAAPCRPDQGPRPTLRMTVFSSVTSGSVHASPRLLDPLCVATA